MIPQVLSPAGSMESLIAAVRSGADAIYLGVESFNARKSAQNFGDSDLLEAVAYCHIRGVKVYLTLNTVVFDTEISALTNTAILAANAGIDAFIVQDLGVAKIINRLVPEIPLHASTQMSIMSPSALPLLKKLGFCRVVLAREMDKNSIKEICSKANELNIEVEVFVHGALCMSVSGQCYLSAVLGGRSGNRGLCAGPCRLPFYVSGGTGYDLSLKDLSLYGKIQELVDMGVCSFKIEGRLKRPEYVAVATAACRSALDNQTVDDQLQKNLENIFSRSGFTSGYYENKTGRDMFGTRNDENIVAAKAAIPEIHNIYRRERQSVPVSFEFYCEEEENIKLKISDGVNDVFITGGMPQRAVNRPIDPKTVEIQLSKLGSTCYYLKSFKYHIDEGFCLPMSEINQLRRSACERLDEVRCRVNNPKIKSYVFDKVDVGCKSKKTALVARFASNLQIPNDLSNLDAMIIPLSTGVVNVAAYYKIPVILEIPRGLLGIEQSVKRELEIAKQKGYTSALCGSIAAIQMCLMAGMIPIGDFGLNITNSISASVIQELGVEATVVSFELSRELANGVNTSKLKKGYIAYGRQPLMLLKNCPVKNETSCEKCGSTRYITDRKEIKFPINCCGGFSQLYNSRPLWVLDRAVEFKEFDFSVLYFTIENKERCSVIIMAALERMAADCEYTRGNYYNAVK